MNLSRTQVLAIDLGSTCFKAAVFDPAFCQLGAHSRYLSYLSRNTKVELAVDEVKIAFCEIIKGAVEKAGINVSNLGGIAVTSQAQTFTLAENGTPTIPFISWEDSRGAEALEEMKNDGRFSDFSSHCSFYEPNANLQLSQLARLKKKGLINESTELISLPSFLIKMLCGESITDSNLAAMSGLYSLKKKDWHKEYLEFCGLKNEQLSRVIPAGCIAGVTANQTEIFGLPEGIPVHSCGNDQTAGAFGAQLGKNSLLITLGTAQVIYQHSDKLPPAGASMIRGIYPYNGFYRLICGDSGGNLISKAIDVNSQIKDFDDFFNKAEIGKNKALPDIDFNLRDSLISAGKKLSQESFAFALLKHLCDDLKEKYDRLTASGEEPEKIMIAGGGAENRLWVDMIEERLGRKLFPVDANPLLGAAKMIKVDK